MELSKIREGRPTATQAAERDFSFPILLRRVLLISSLRDPIRLTQCYNDTLFFLLINITPGKMFVHFVDKPFNFSCCSCAAFLVCRNDASIGLAQHRIWRRGKDCGSFGNIFNNTWVFPDFPGLNGTERDSQFVSQIFLRQFSDFSGGF